MIDAINEVRVRGDSCGGEVTCVVRNCPKGLGTPVFDKLEAELAKAMLSLPSQTDLVASKEVSPMGRILSSE
jgi:chorismate synthase